jgi:hypothetical protein
MRAKKQFRTAAKGRRIDETILDKSKEKILSLWKIGSQSQEIIKNFIEKILSERRKSLHFT